MFSVAGKIAAFTAKPEPLGSLWAVVIPYVNLLSNETIEPISESRDIKLYYDRNTAT